jgi:hypothetical protein
MLKPQLLSTRQELTARATTFILEQYVLFSFSVGPKRLLQCLVIDSVLQVSIIKCSTFTAIVFSAFCGISRDVGRPYWGQ